MLKDHELRFRKLIIAQAGALSKATPSLTYSPLVTLWPEEPRLSSPESVAA
jgi:hypothetical protein